VEQPHWGASLTEAYDNALAYLTALPDRPVGSVAARDELWLALGGPLPEVPADPVTVIEALAAGAEPGLMRNQSGRFFGFVVGGAAPAALAADWLTAAWDQNAGLFVLAPAASVVEEVAGEWLRQLLGLPATVSVGFVTGGQMANLTALAAGRNEVLRRYSWDVEADGLIGAPRIRILAGAQRHDTIDRALRFLGLGRAGIVPVLTDDQGRMLPTALTEALDGGDVPTIVCTQVGQRQLGRHRSSGRALRDRP
jgi:glutamate/tyrosine decarboxylase-like PLP-dependent enzyme